MSPEGSSLYVLGGSDDGDSAGATTVSYDLATGSRIWLAHLEGQAIDSTVAPSGAAVYVTARGDGSSLKEGFITSAQSAVDGTLLWTKRFNDPAVRSDAPVSMAINPDGSTLYVTGQTSRPDDADYDYLTVAYDALDGLRRIWTRRFDGRSDMEDRPVSVEVSPGGSKVFVTGSSDSLGHATDYATVAYNGVTGERLWTRRYVGPVIWTTPSPWP